MTLAELHGKSPLSGSEDFLTADVFTAFRYLPPGPGLIGFLRTIPGLADHIPDSGQAAAAIHFWPVGQMFNREPDVLLELDLDGRLFHVVVEAKYYSGPSDLEYDLLVGEETLKAGKQLGGEYLDLQNSHYRIFESGVRDRHLTLRSHQADRFLLYLTAHPVRPDSELDAALADHPQMAGRLLWASWYQVFEHFQNLWGALTEFPYDRVLADICLLLERKGFFTFHGFEAVPALHRTSGTAVFWQDVRPGEIDFAGITRPPELTFAPALYPFWNPSPTGDIDG